MRTSCLPASIRWIYFLKRYNVGTVRSPEWTWEVCSACLQRGVEGRQVKMLTRQTRAQLLTHRVGNVGLTSERWGEPHTVHLKGKKVKSQVVCSSVKLLCSFLGQTNSPMRATFRLGSDSVLQIRLNTCHRPGLPSQPWFESQHIFFFLTINVEQTKILKKEGGGRRGKVRTGNRWGLPPRSLLNASAQFQLAKGCDEVIVGPLVIRQLQVPRTHHHHHVGPRLLSCFSLCQDESQYECHTESSIFPQKTVRFC